ncbi:MAG: hypothetical protein M1371_04080 [Actinobacteria bacterium]|nr:hypothetical protein [Actinomycetota bacterium]MCL5985727.1 hypothetical protein [Actinomycetota bacterium]
MKELKKCTKCGELKPSNTNNFRRNKNSKDKLYCWCKSCCQKSYHDYYSVPENKEKALAGNKRRYQVYRSNPSVWEEMKKKQKQYYEKYYSKQENKDKVKARSRQRYEKIMEAYLGAIKETKEKSD